MPARVPLQPQRSAASGDLQSFLVEHAQYYERTRDSRSCPAVNDRCSREATSRLPGTSRRLEHLETPSTGTEHATDENVADRKTAVARHCHHVITTNTWRFGDGAAVNSKWLEAFVPYPSNKTTTKNTSVLQVISHNTMRTGANHKRCWEVAPADGSGNKMETPKPNTQHLE
ncbi:hypothetical protein MRX96_001354 [Rhipicephalus microplus]